YDAMRERCPVAHSETMGWSLFRHADVLGVIDDPETFSNASRHHAIPNALDDPEHGPYRARLVPFFSDERMAALEPGCREVAADAVAALRDNPAPEAISGLAEPVSLRVLCR